MCNRWKVFVCKCRHLVLAGGSRATAGGGGARTGAGGMPGFMSPRIASPMHPSQGGRGRGGFGGVSVANLKSIFELHVDQINRPRIIYSVGF